MAIDGRMVWFGVLWATTASCAQILGIEELTLAPDAGSQPPPTVDAPAGTDEPVLLAKNPAPDATGVDPMEEIWLEFSAEIDTTKITPDSLTVVSSSEQHLDGNIEVDGHIVRFEPSLPLSLRSDYTVTFAVQDNENEPLEVVYSWRFVVRDGNWRASESIENRADAAQPQVAINAHGDTMAVWQQIDGTHRTIWGAPWHPEEGWRPPMRIDNAPGGEARNPQIALNDDGDAIIVWEHVNSDGTQPRIWSNFYSAEFGLAAAELLSDDASGDRAPRLAGNSAGSGLVVWERADGSIWANYSDGIHWHGNEMLASVGRAPQVAIDRRSVGLAVWEDMNGIMVRHYEPDEDWYPAQSIAPQPGYRPLIGIDDRGEALAVWTEQTTPPYQLQTTRAAPEQGWIDTMPLPDTTPADSFAFFMGPGGHAAVALTEPIQNDLLIHPYLPDIGWMQAQRIGGAVSANKRLSPGLGIDGQGNAFVVWWQTGTDQTQPSEAWVQRYVADVDWKSPLPLRAPLSVNDNASAPTIAVSPQGAASVVWLQSEGGRVSVYSRAFR